MGTSVVTSYGNISKFSQSYRKSVVTGRGNTAVADQEVNTLLHISGSKGLVFDAAGGALTNDSTGAKNIIDFEGILRPTLANEIRSCNARRIYNSHVYGNDFSNAVWVGSNAGIGSVGVITPDYTLAPDGLSNAARIQLNLNGSVSLSDQSVIKYNVVTPVGLSTVSLYLKSNDPTTAYTIVLIRSGAAAVAVKIYYNEWLRYCVNTGVTVETPQIYLRGAQSVSDYADISIAYDMMEANAAASNTGASEYIDGNTIYNAGVIGVRYSGHENRNHVLNGFSRRILPYSNVMSVGDSISVITDTYNDKLSILANNPIDNYGVSGQRLTGVILDNFLAHINDKAYEAVIIQGGVNDVKVYTPLATMQNAIQTMVSAAKTSGVRDIYILDILPFKGFATWAQDQADILLAYNAWLYVWGPLSGCIVVRMYERMGDRINDTQALLPAFGSADHIHPSLTGFLMMHAIILEAMHRAGDQYLINNTLSILHEPAATNLALLPRDLTNAAYVKTDCTAAKTATGTDGVLNSASILTATAANATCLQTVTSASAERITGAFIKRRTGTGAVEMTQDNGTTWTPVTVPATWGAEALVIPAATVADPVFGFRIVTSGDAIDVDWVQHELGSHITSPISGSRTIDSIKIPLVANVNFPQSKGIAFIKITPQFDNSATAKSILCTETNTVFVRDSGSGEIEITDGTNTATTSGLGGWSAGDVLSIRACWITDTMSIHVKKNDGAWVDSSDTTYEGSFPVSTNFLLCNANTDSVLINSMKIKSTTKNLSDAQAWSLNAFDYEAV